MPPSINAWRTEIFQSLDIKQALGLTPAMKQHDIQDKVIPNSKRRLFLSQKLRMHPFTLTAPG
jgi:hypothetical protein